MSSLAGSCFEGVCFCKPAFHVQKSGKCGSAPPECATSGGHCEQNQTACAAGEVTSSPAASMSCGDLVPAVCCFAPADCNGPTFHCCAPNDSSPPPICENGWLTCPENTTPTTGPCG
jgi:hypothetical protein